MLAVDQASGSPAAALSSRSSIFQKNKSHRNAGLLFAFVVRTIAWLRARGLNQLRSEGLIQYRLKVLGTHVHVCISDLGLTNFAICYMDSQKVAIYII